MPAVTFFIKVTGSLIPLRLLFRIRSRRAFAARLKARTRRPGLPPTFFGDARVQGFAIQSENSCIYLPWTRKSAALQGPFKGLKSCCFCQYSSRQSVLSWRGGGGRFAAPVLHDHIKASYYTGPGDQNHRARVVFGGDFSRLPAQIARRQEQPVPLAYFATFLVIMSGAALYTMASCLPILPARYSASRLLSMLTIPSLAEEKITESI